MSKVFIQSNSIFHKATQRSVFDVREEDNFKRYRRMWMEYPEEYIVGEYPLHLDIESTSVCNLKCPFCARTYSRWGGKKDGFMDMNLYKRIIDQAVDNGLFAIKLSLRGEPLLHPQIVEMVDYAKHRGILDVYFNTNAMLLDEEMSEKLIDVRLDRISISAEGTTAKVYEKYRPGASFDKVLNNVEILRNLRQKSGLPFPQIRIQTVLTDELKASFSDYVSFWERIADEVSYLDCRQEKPGVDHRGRIGSWACAFLWQRMTILWDGTLLPCLAHGISDFSTLVLGVIPEVTVKKMWKSEKLEKMRSRHKKRQAHLITGCNECSYRAMELDKLDKKG